MKRRWARVLLPGASILFLALALFFFFAPSLGGRISGERLARIERSRSFRDGRAQNTVPTSMSLPGSTWTTIRLQLGDEIRVPTSPLPIVSRARADFDSPPASGLRATRLGHSTVLIEIDGFRVLTDPIWSERCSPISFIGPVRFHPPPIAIEELPEIDAVVISHDHYDHLDMSTIEALAARGGVRFVVPLGIGAHLERWRIAGERVAELDWGERTTIRGLELIATPGRHFSGRRGTDTDATLWASWVMRGPAHRVYYSGDTGFFDGFQKIGAEHGPFDLTLIKIGAYGATWPDIHVDPEQAVRAHVDLRGRVLLPVHWGTFNLAFHDWFEPAERVVAAARTASVALLMPRFGEMVEPERRPAIESWWR